MKPQITIDQFVNQEIIYNQTGLVNLLLAKSVEDQDIADMGFNWENLPDPENDQEPDEIFSWYLVTTWLAEQLKDEGETILTTDNGSYWGRTTFGQMISQDNVVNKIYNDLQ